jgi:hypothetical protein
MNGKNVSVLSFDMYDLVKMKYHNMNQMIGLKEIFVLPSSKLFASWPTLRECFKCGKGNNWTINYNGTSGQNKMKDYCNYRVHPPSVLSRLFPGKQKSGTTFLQGREDDVTMPRQSTFTMWSRQLFKVKAKLSSQLFRFPPTRLLLGLYDYRFKHIAVMEEEYHDIITTLQVIRLLQLFGQQELESRTTPFQGREDDMTMPAPTASPTTFLISIGPITRSRAKKIQQEVHALLY